MSDEQQKICNDCNHGEDIHGILREPYGRLCTGCLDGGNMDPCRNFSKWLQIIFSLVSEGFKKFLFVLIIS